MDSDNTTEYCNFNVEDDPRLAGEIRRYHTSPVRPQTVGEHSWQIGRIILAVLPEKHFAAYLSHAILHDIGEIRTGDIPYTAKQNSPELAKAVRTFEAHSVSGLCWSWGIRSGRPKMSEEDLTIFKAIELVEMWEFGCSEWVQGNRYGKVIAERCSNALRLKLEEVKDTQLSREEDVYTNIHHYISRRIRFWGVPFHA